jgi:2,4-dienoyl-CoA reductase-like NADH-dependent reductase (Old Yellow Enzyme family)
MPFENIFSPITMRRMTASNRIMRTSMVSGLTTEDGLVTDALKQRYQREAKGGVGLLVVEAAVILPSRSSFNLRISDDSLTDGLKGLVDAVRSANPETKIGIQTMHFLKIARSGWRQKVEDFKLEELPVIVEQHVQRPGGRWPPASTSSRFIWPMPTRSPPLSPDRTAEPTPTAESWETGCACRLRFMKRCGNPSARIIPWASGSTVKTSQQAVAPCCKARGWRSASPGWASITSAFPAGSRFEDAAPPAPNMPPDPMSGYSGHRMSPWWWFPDMTHVHLAQAIRDQVRRAGFNAPVVAAGKIRTPHEAERILAEGKADLIGLCRPLLCDPDWPKKAREKKAREIVHCTSCNWCLEADSRYEKVTCSRWPEGAVVAPDQFTAAMARPSELPDDVSL